MGKLYLWKFRMDSKRPTYNLFQKISGIFLILALLWLTASAPFVAEIKNEINKQSGILVYNGIGDTSETTNPYAGLNEEQCSGNGGFSEYLHEAVTFTLFAEQQLSHKCFVTGEIYIAYYGELLSPPPEC